MGQHDVYQFLKEHPEKWLTKEEICIGLQCSRGSVNQALKKMIQYNEVLEKTKIKLNNYQITRFYKLKK